MKQCDVLIVGGGCIGLTAALALSQAGLSVVLADAGASPSTLPALPLNRVSALNLQSQALLTALGAWHAISRLAPYQGMAVWDEQSRGRISFAADEVGQAQLGHIVENEAIRLALVSQLALQRQCSLLWHTSVSQLHQGDHEVFVTLSNGQPVLAKLVVSAEGAQSSLRQQLAIPLTFWDYDHHAIVANIQTALPHEGIARQVFLNGGPLALLPLADAQQCSIVWSCPPAQAQALMAMADDDFAKALAGASELCLGPVRLISERASHPLTMRYARKWREGRVLFIGDAAHTIHPLAGLGMNLGLADVDALQQLLSQRRKNQQPLFCEFALTDYERARKAQAQQYIATMELLKRLFTEQNPAIKLLRGVGLRAVDKFTPLKHKFIETALGL